MFIRQRHQLLNGRKSTRILALFGKTMLVRNCRIRKQVRLTPFSYFIITSSRIGLRARPRYKRCRMRVSSLFPPAVRFETSWGRLICQRSGTNNHYQC